MRKIKTRAGAHAFRAAGVKCQWWSNNPHLWSSNFPTHQRQGKKAMARFPIAKTLETFDFEYQPSINCKQALQLVSCRFIEHGDNVICWRRPGWARLTWPCRWA